MGVPRSHLEDIERGRVTEWDELAGYALALGGRLRLAILFDDGDIALVE
jgi:ketopantoate reductase